MFAGASSAKKTPKETVVPKREMEIEDKEEKEEEKKPEEKSTKDKDNDSDFDLDDIEEMLAKANEISNKKEESEKLIQPQQPSLNELIKQTPVSILII